jgi:hypothetical protein
VPLTPKQVMEDQLKLQISNEKRKEKKEFKKRKKERKTLIRVKKKEEGFRP